jgi:bacterial leucyl aminopeptidase
VLLEALRVLANNRYAPRNTLEFHFYSGEEGGLLGSRDIMQAYARNGVNVLAVLNQVSCSLTTAYARMSC